MSLWKISLVCRYSSPFNSDFTMILICLELKLYLLCILPISVPGICRQVDLPRRAPARHAKFHATRIHRTTCWDWDGQYPSVSLFSPLLLAFSLDPHSEGVNSYRTTWLRHDCVILFQLLDELLQSFLDRFSWSYESAIWTPVGWLAWVTSLSTSLAPRCLHDKSPRNC